MFFDGTIIDNREFKKKGGLNVCIKHRDKPLLSKLNEKRYFLGQGKLLFFRAHYLEGKIR